MAELCVRVSWEVTRACQVHLPLDALFSPATFSQEEEKAALRKDPLSLVESAIKCCKEWRNCYVEVRYFSIAHTFILPVYSRLLCMFMLTMIMNSCVSAVLPYFLSIYCCIKNLIPPPASMFYF